MSLHQDTPLTIGPYTLTVAASDSGDSISYTASFNRITLAQAQGVRRTCALTPVLEPAEFVALRRDCETANVIALFGDSQDIGDLEEGQSPSTLNGWTAGGSTSYGDPTYCRAFVQIVSGFSCLGVNGTPIYPDPDDFPYDPAEFVVQNAIPIDHPELVESLPPNCEQIARCVGNPFAATGFFGTASLRWTYGGRYYPITVSASGGTFTGAIGTPVPDFPAWIGTIPHQAGRIVEYLGVNYYALYDIPTTETGESNPTPPNDPRWSVFTVTDHIQITKYPNGIKVAFAGLFLNLAGYNLLHIVSDSFTQATAASNYNIVSVDIEAAAFGTAGGLFDPPAVYGNNALVGIQTISAHTGSYLNPTDFSFSYSEGGITASFAISPL